MPRFGWGTIRRFANKASEMKKLGARDYEDLLQCAIPAFDGLFQKEEDNKLVLRLLFKMAEWHGFAKLRMHSEDTIDHLEKLTRDLGNLVRKFHQDVCSRTETYELQRESDARHRRTADRMPSSAVPPTTSSTRMPKLLNLNTYKWHSMPDYPNIFPWFGPSDIYSTQPVRSDLQLRKLIEC